MSGGSGSRPPSAASAAASAASGRAPSPNGAAHALHPRPDSAGSETEPWSTAGGSHALPALRSGRRRVSSMDPFPRDAHAEGLLLGSPHDSAAGQDPRLAGGPLDSPHRSGPASWRACLMQEPLLLWTLVGVLAGIVLGAALKPAALGPQAIELIGFPGELMLRLLKMLVLPLVSVSMVAGVLNLRQQDDGGDGQRMRRLAHLTAAYYVGSTLLAIVVGILLVVAVHPGRGAPFDHIASGGGDCRQAHTKEVQQAGTHSGPRAGTTDALLNVARQVVPDNIVVAAVNTNVLGLITFSLMFGVALGSLGPAADHLAKQIGVVNAAVQRMVSAALWLSPLGVGSLVAASILRACDLLGTLAALGLWVATVLAGLALFAFVLLPLLLWAATGRSPLAVARQFAASLLLAFGTGSSVAALPAAMQAAKEGGCDEATVDFFLPLGTTVNMNGTALYEATTAIFIAQAHGVRLGLAELLVVAFTASLAAVGAPAIPSAGLVTMLIVLQAVSLDQYAADLAVILAIDWALDRCRTAVNILGDAYGCVLVDHLLQRRPRGGGSSSGGGGGGPGSKQIPYVQLELGEAQQELQPQGQR